MINNISFINVRKNKYELNKYKPATRGVQLVPAGTPTNYKSTNCRAKPNKYIGKI